MAVSIAETSVRSQLTGAPVERSVRGVAYTRFDLIYGAAVSLAALAVTSRLWLHPRTTMLTNEQDQIFFQWVLAHALRVITHAENPFFTDRLNAPDGVNMMANTSVLGLGLPLAPVTLVFGADVSFILLLTIGLAGTAFAWYWVLSRHVVGSRWPAAVGGAFCGFAPAMISQAQAHPNLVAQFVVPFIVWCVLCLGDPDRIKRNGVVLGLLVSYQAFLNEEVLLFTALACGVYLAAWAAQHRATAKARLSSFAKALAIAGLTATAILAYPLWVQFLGPQHYRGLLHGHQHGADLGSFTAFATESLTARGQPAVSSVHFAEEATFYGTPLVVLLVCIVVWLRKDRIVRALVATGLVFAVAAVGWPAKFNGTTLDLPTPWGWVRHLPLLDAVIPVRLALVLVPIAGILLALACARIPSPRTNRFAFNIALLALAAALVPIAPTFLNTTRQPAVPPLITTGSWREYLVDDTTMVTMPLPAFPRPDGMRWAASADLGFRLAGGYFLGPKDGRVGANAQFGAPPRPTAELIEHVARTGRVPELSPQDVAHAQADLAFWNAGLVVVEPGHLRHGAIRLTLTELLGMPGEWRGGVWLWDVRKMTQEQDET